MSIPSRTSIVSGPGAITFGGETIHAQGDISAALETTSQDLVSSLLGRMDAMKADQSASISMTPCGELTEDQLVVLFPHQSPVIGSSLFTGTDAPLVVLGMDGRKLTFHAAALVGVPSLDLSPVRPAFGAARWQALLAAGKAPHEASALYTEAAQAWGNAVPSAATMLTAVYTGALGATTIYTADGWRVSVELATSPVPSDDAGTVDLLLAGITVRASCVPVGITAAQVLAQLPPLLARGTRMAGASDLVISAASALTVTLKNARAVTGPLQWGSTTLRAGELGFLAHLATDGTLYSVAMTPEPEPPAP